MKIVLLVLVLLAAPGAFAQVPMIVGDDAPDFSAAETFNDTEYRTLADCEGDVAVVRIY